MNKRILISLLFTLTSTSLMAGQDDATIKRLIIQQSIASYSGNCPCPYNTMKNGQACGGRSAYSKPGGSSPICYEEDVTPEMINAWKKQHLK